jgi:tetratricopeptide (TPR) repeat protein
MDLATWDTRIEAFYREVFDEHDPARTVAAMGELLATMEADDAGALVPFEMAGVHDSLGLEDDAVPLYREALSAGLDASHAAQARIQLASTLRNLGRLDEALELLAVPAEGDLEPARKAFLALALHTAGRPDEALREAIEGIVPSLTRYRRSLAAYAASLTAGSTK